MKKPIFSLSILLCLSGTFCNAQNRIVTTIAGTGSYGYTGDGGPATAATIGVGTGIAVDNAGNVYFTDNTPSVIRKITPAGIITTVAGTGSYGFSGDGGPATAAMLNSPGDVVVDGAGNLYIADGNNFRIRKVDAAGIISTIAGNGTAGFSGTGGPATAAEIWPARLGVDAAGNVYSVEGVYQTVRKIDVTSGIISLVAGTTIGGYSGDGGPATAAQLDGPGGVKFDGAGNTYIMDAGNIRVRKINTAGIISTYAGTGISGYSGDGGPALAAEFSSGNNIGIDDFGDLYLTDYGNNRIREVYADGIITTAVGTGAAACGPDYMTATATAINSPGAVCTDHAGNIYFTDNCNRVRKVSNPPYAATDSFSVYINELCSGPEFTIVTSPGVTGLSVTTYFGDGSSSTSAVTSGYITVSHTYAISGTYTVKHVLYRGSTAVDSVSYPYVYMFCSAFPLTFYYDANANCVKDSGEPYISLPILAAVDSNGIPIDTFSATNGAYYNAYGVPGDVYTFRVISMPAGLGFTCSGTGIITDTLSASVYTNPAKNTGLVCTSGATSFDLLEHTGTQTGRHMQSGTIMTGNNFCTPEDAVVTLTFSPKYNFSSSTPAATSVSGNTATWNLSGLSTYNSGQLNIAYTLSVPSTWIVPGDTAMSDVVINPETGDVDTSNNWGKWCDTIKISYDPNEMLVTPEGTITAGTQLQYTINFENTGNDTAFNIYVMDTLPNGVIPTSLKIVSASANMMTSQLKTAGMNIERFDFPNINLLDSAYHNQCNGSIIFTINTQSGLANGTTILNHAGIFFDDNPVVMTDTVTDIIGIPTTQSGVNTTHTNNVSVYPNPATNELTITTNNSTYSSYTITNDLGQVLMQQPLNNVQTKVDIQSLPSGLYYISLKGDNGSTVQKFVKM